MLNYERLMFLAINSILIIYMVFNSFNYLNISVGILFVIVIFNFTSLIYKVIKIIKSKKLIN
ncbi:MAG: hypothetical protein GX275_04805 [Clostridiales bacterium]|nr:hypothetical protein [Clostridiales bacterium]